MRRHFILEYGDVGAVISKRKTTQYSYSYARDPEIRRSVPDLRRGGGEGGGGGGGGGVGTLELMFQDPSPPPPPPPPSPPTQSL